MKDYRIFVEKKTIYQVEAQSLKEELNENLQLDIKNLRLLKVYDLFGFTEELLEKTKYKVFGEKVTDMVSTESPIKDENFIAVEYLPGQFDQRASSAVDCVHLIEPSAKVDIKSAKLIILDKELSETDLDRIKQYYINTVESREKDLGKLSNNEQPKVKPVGIIEGFREIIDDTKGKTSPSEEEQHILKDYCKSLGLVMSADDLFVVVKYFQEEGRDPNETEIRILDTYWSDHCRHTTFTTEIEDIEVEESFIKDDIEETFNIYLKIRKELERDKKPITLMDMATIGARYLKSKGLLDDQEVSEENNACSIYVDVDNDGIKEQWLLMFKNETHNHPTEIEPFGGAATCLGGAIRDPLSGRSYVYQAMRITGAANVLATVGETRPGKLPQKLISRQAANGYSSYGNQIGLATTYVKEIYHPGYEAKRMEIGAVVGAVKADNVRRETPKDGDVILLLGGRTGRDGVGGATGSSKQHTEESIDICGSEVQKGNPPEERKLQRLFRIPEITRLIKKSNDFGAGGVSVAIGELADSLDIFIDKVPTKYDGLNSLELSISESQERMAVVIEKEDFDKFVNFCRKENVEVTLVGRVTDTGRMRIYDEQKLIADLSRRFIDSAGAKHYTNASVGAVDKKNPFNENISKDCQSVESMLLDNLKDMNMASQKGLVEMFDSSIGRSTILMPFGGKTQLTPTQVSVQKLPTQGYTNTASMMAYGFDPYLSAWSPYHGAAYAVVDACAKVVAAGGDFKSMRFSYQEYFERMRNEKSWGKPLSALLGALKMQLELELPSIGGKDSMSGSFEDIDVPPTLVAFGITAVDARNVISPELKGGGSKLYIIPHNPLPNFMPNVEELKNNWQYVNEEIKKGNILSAYALERNGVAPAVAVMAMGNLKSVELKTNPDMLFNSSIGSIVVEAKEELHSAIEIGVVTDDERNIVSINGEEISLEKIVSANLSTFDKIYPIKRNLPWKENFPMLDKLTPTEERIIHRARKEHPKVYIPVFPGTNCEYDTAKAFIKAGAEVEIQPFCNLYEDDIYRSIKNMAEGIRNSDILMLAGGFSSGDEPDGSGKYIANVLANKEISEEIELLLQRGGLILGICNGFQALVKSGLLPYGKMGQLKEDSPTLFRNDINRHISQVVSTRIVTKNSPWLTKFDLSKTYGVAVSHGEGKFVVTDEEAKELFRNSQVAFQYVDPFSGQPTMEGPYNPNGSYYAIEGITSRNGQILGKMGHSERYEQHLMKNIYEDMYMPLFESAVDYFRKGDR